MGHYDSSIAQDATDKIHVTKKMIKNLEKEIENRDGNIIVYDDAIGMTKLKIAKESEKLDSKMLSGSSWEIFIK